MFLSQQREPSTFSKAEKQAWEKERQTTNELVTERRKIKAEQLEMKGQVDTRRKAEHYVVWQ